MRDAKQPPEEQSQFDALVSQAATDHQAGRLVEAAAGYRKILALRPELFEVHNNLGLVLRNLGQLDEAVQRFEHALHLRPDCAEAHFNLGTTLKRQGKLDEATARFELALACRPGYAEALYQLGNLLSERGQWDEAAARYLQALTLRPDYPEAYNNLGNVYLQQNKLELAAIQFKHAIRLRPKYADAHYNLGNVLKEQNKPALAEACYVRALALRPNLAQAHINLGIVLRQQKRLDEAAAHYRQALALQPDSAEAHNNLGVILWEQVQFEQALTHYNQALTLRPDYSEALHNLGITLLDQRKPSEARQVFERLKSIDPDSAAVDMDLSVCYLLEGDYERGWQAYEARLRMPDATRLSELPRWRGEPLEGRSLLLVTEQGFGDMFEFIRYARPLRERGARVVLGAWPPLGPLLESFPDKDELFLVGSGPEPQCDFHLPLLSAPYALGTSLSTIPREIPYLWAEADLTEHWRQELAGIEGFKIGIAWQGSRGYQMDRWRSLPLRHFAALARLPGVQLISLQKGPGTEQIASVDFPLLDLSGQLDETTGPFMDTAAVISNLDLVATSDTAVAHLAGALGVPVFVALPWAADFRWLLDRDDSPWYPTMRLFRQQAFGQWPDVFQRMAEAVEPLLAEKR